MNELASIINKLYPEMVFCVDAKKANHTIDKHDFELQIKFRADDDDFWGSWKSNWRSSDRATEIVTITYNSKNNMIGNGSMPGYNLADPNSLDKVILDTKLWIVSYMMFLTVGFTGLIRDGKLCIKTAKLSNERVARFQWFLTEIKDKAPKLSIEFSI